MQFKLSDFCFSFYRDLIQWLQISLNPKYLGDLFFDKFLCGRFTLKEENLVTCLFVNDGTGKFVLIDLSTIIRESSVYASPVFPEFKLKSIGNSNSKN